MMRKRQMPPASIVSIALCLLVLAAIAAGCSMSSPAVVSTQPANGATAISTSATSIRVDFDQPMNRQTVERAFSIRPEVGTTKPKFAWSNNEKTVVAMFDQPLQANTQYTVTIGTRAVAGNNVALGQPTAFSFTTSPTAVAGATAEPSPTTPAPVADTPPATVPAEEAPAPPAVSFAKDIQPIAKTSCDGCHAAQSTGKMSDYDNIVSKKYVVSGDADSSPYYKKGSALDKHSGNDAWKANKQLVRDWIAGGAAK